LTFKLKASNFFLDSKILAKFHVIQAYYQKIDFIGKTSLPITKPSLLYH